MSAAGIETGAAAAMAHSWIAGIGISILGSIIGGASKLSIRKSWIIDSKRKETHCCQLDGERTSVSIEGEASDLETNKNKKTESNYFASLEEVVVSPPSKDSSDHSSTTRQESFSCDESLETATDYDDDTAGGCHQASAASHCCASPLPSSWLYYLSGMIGMSFLNPLCCVLAMRAANPSILAPFSGLSLVWVTLLSPVTLGEHPGRSQRVACGLIVSGEVLVAVFGDHSNEGGRSVEDVIASYQDLALHAFILLMILFIVQLGIFIRVCPADSLLRKVAWGSIGGSIMGFQNFHKDSLTIYDAVHESNMQHIQGGGGAETQFPVALYLFPLAAAAVAFAGLMGLAACMKRYDATYSVAMFVVSYVVSASLMSAAHYQTFDHLAGDWSYFFYPLGLATLISGAFVLVRPDVLDSCFDSVDGDDQFWRRTAATREEKQPVISYLDSMTSVGGPVSHYERECDSNGDHRLLSENGPNYGSIGRPPLRRMGSGNREP